jgi:hypothetical protein
LLTATVVRLAVRNGKWRALALAACAGALSHVTLDLIAGADIRPFWPLAERVVSWPLFAMADPWLFGLFVAALALLWRARRPRVAAAVLAAFVAMSGAKAALFARASRADARAAGDATITRADAGFGSWRDWTFFHVIDDRVDRWHVDAVAATARRVFAIDRGLDAPRIAASRSLPTVAHLIAAHGITFARVSPRADGGYDVLWSDLRYCGATLEGSAPVCGLWFGGEYDARGRAIDAVVRLGSFAQRRSAGTSSGDQ